MISEIFMSHSIPQLQITMPARGSKLRYNNAYMFRIGIVVALDDRIRFILKCELCLLTYAFSATGIVSVCVSRSRML